MTHVHCSAQWPGKSRYLIQQANKATVDLRYCVIDKACPLGRKGMIDAGRRQDTG